MNEWVVIEEEEKAGNTKITIRQRSGKEWVRYGRA